MEHTQKITAHVPVDLLRRAQAATGSGITETVRRGLEMVASAEAANRILALEGKVRLDIDLDELRRDKR